MRGPFGVQSTSLVPVAILGTDRRNAGLVKSYSIEQ